MEGVQRMGKVLYLIANLHYNGLAQQMTRLAAGTARTGFDVRVCVLGDEGPLADELRDASIQVEVLGWMRWLSLGAVRRLREVIDSWSPNLLHAWGLSALRAAGLTSGIRPSPIIVSRPVPPGRTRLTLADRWLLRRADHLVAQNQVEAGRLLALGVDPSRVTVVPPGVELVRVKAGERPTLSDRKYILTVGPFTPEKGHYDALWAFDILQYLFAQPHLVLVGEGPEKPRLLSMARGLEARRNIHFLGAASDVPALLARAELVWVPSRSAGGVQTALEALASGTPVIATRVPELAETLAPLGEDVLVPPGDKPALVRHTRRLLEDAGRRRQLSDRGREFVTRAFSTEQMVRRYVGLYQKRAG
jgi:glycosyltransferase involved in cell wall biosynthesis